jgi:predicted TIM-barrel fold metal-dependent hydrolase
MRIDVFAHILTPRYLSRVLEILSARGDQAASDYEATIKFDPTLTDLDARFKFIDEIAGQDYRQVLVMAHTQAEHEEPGVAIDLADTGNQELAEAVAANPDRFAGWAAQVALQAGDQGLARLEQTITQDGATGVQVFTQIQGKCLDHPDFEPFFELMAKLGRPIWIHPNRTAQWSDFPLTEPESRFHLFALTGWPSDTANVMYRLMCAGYLERWPELKIITHNSGGTVPMLAGRLKGRIRGLGADDPANSAHEPLDYLRLFYADTANFGNPIALRAALEFFGEDNVMFGSDFGFSPKFLPETVLDVELVATDPAVKEKLYERNARRVLGLGDA